MGQGKTFSKVFPCDLFQKISHKKDARTCVGRKGARGMPFLQKGIPRKYSGKLAPLGGLSLAEVMDGDRGGKIDAKCLPRALRAAEVNVGEGVATIECNLIYACE